MLKKFSPLPFLSKFDLEVFLSILCALVFLIKFLNSFYLYAHSDPLNYHLAMSKILLLDGPDSTYRFNTHFLMTGLFDYLYLIPHLIFRNTFYSQLMGQTLHFLVSLALGAIIAYRNIPHKTIALLGILLFLTLSNSAEFFLYAKNDGALATISLIACIMILEKKTRSPILTGFILGLLPAIKMTGLFMAIPLAGIYLITNFNKPVHLFKAAIMFMLVWSPLLIRNYLYTHNPFFPGLLNFFPGNLHSSAHNYYTAFMSSHFTWGLVPQQLKACFLPKWIFVFLPVFVVMNYKIQKQINRYLIPVIVFFILYLVTNGGVVYPRFFFSCHFLLSLYLLKSLQGIYVRYGHHKTIILLACLIFLSDSKLDKNLNHIKKAIGIYANASSTLDIINTMIPLTRFWNLLPKESPSTIYVISDLSTQFYHAPPFVRLEQPEHNREANFLKTCSASTQQNLSRYHYALLYYHDINPCYKLIEQKGEKLLNTLDFTLYKISPN